MLNPYYVYRHIRSDTGQIFYIGKGKNRRGSYLYERAHAVKHRSKWWQAIAAKCGGVIIEIIMELSTPDECVAKERKMIALYGRADCGNGPLVNLTDGGDGSWGMRVSDELRQKRSDQIRGVKHPNFGKTLSEETCRRKSDAIKGDKHFLYGKKLTKDWKRNIAAGKVGELNPMFGRCGELHPRSKRVMDAQTGVVYGSVAAAAKAVGLKPSIVYQYLDGSRKNLTSLVKV